MAIFTVLHTSRSSSTGEICTNDDDVAVQFEIDVRNFGREISWETAPASSAFGGPYANDRSYSHWHCLPTGARYTFVARDSYGDGWGAGSYSVRICHELVVGPSVVLGSGRSDESFNVTVPTPNSCGPDGMCDGGLCVCDAGHGGVHCELNASHCNDHGTIAVNGSAAAVADPPCSCTAGYGGVHCELDATHCNDHGTIAVNGSAAAVADPPCSCDAGYASRHCEVACCSGHGQVRSGSEGGGTSAVVPNPPQPHTRTPPSVDAGL